MSREAVIHAYRHVLRHSLRAIQFSKPARYTLRDRLRLAFRKGSVTDFEPLKIKNTVEFLHYATRENGIEHRIVKNLLFVWWMQAKGGRGKPRHKAPTREELEIKTTAYDTFNHNIRMLNESMGLCLPAMTVRDPN
ncbi:hypothetical protein HBI56_061060 [Parastagonospora nodorum]|uniref:DUF1763-domain-containing protein n=2 Tax=Phaeosphaeria nodorum (strain SN15 / ATCC MYA-4574 / FGSC 10173) TaxID=321614 RepID=A0A7U2I0J5_PHANO|nr:hypothetical protein SNOG_08761 [Parastagonospora nodorum SN15]KAH3909514.1 hypothetical protein HBH56_157530 [Parastagonospora nodorum]EAT83929.1 hypothetical protein SNOG_08761 [Parastagonospora nodorum SN15]KAH3922978.1 hypothetical protein HBH54_217210 [Parastagonospora nodorum]KAH3946938.1 hypothetical protein HBH53_124370 [Parastagonospora nodorum]KAH3969582.1 hypothetical protein HBH52_172370 [Parastagonospora nodorum]